MKKIYYIGSELMKIGLIDVDGHNFPNLALMRISSYHKQKVTMWNGGGLILNIMMLFI